MVHHAVGTLEDVASAVSEALRAAGAEAVTHADGGPVATFSRPVIDHFIQQASGCEPPACPRAITATSPRTRVPPGPLCKHTRCRTFRRP